MRSTVIILMSSFLTLALCSAPALADGGRIVLMERQRDYRISVFTSPEPLRAGPIDISVLIQDAETGEPIANAQIIVTLTSAGAPFRTIHAVATNGAATNKLLSAALVDLPEPGEWNCEINCLGAAYGFPDPFHDRCRRTPCGAPRCMAMVYLARRRSNLIGIHRRLVWRRRPVSG